MLSLFEGNRGNARTHGTHWPSGQPVCKRTGKIEPQRQITLCRIGLALWGCAAWAATNQMTRSRAARARGSTYGPRRKPGGSPWSHRCVSTPVQDYVSGELRLRSLQFCALQFSKLQKTSTDRSLNNLFFSRAFLRPHQWSILLSSPPVSAAAGSAPCQEVAQRRLLAITKVRQFQAWQVEQGARMCATPRTRRRWSICGAVPWFADVCRHLARHTVNLAFITQAYAELLQISSQQDVSMVQHYRRTVDAAAAHFLHELSAGQAGVDATLELVIPGVMSSDGHIPNQLQDFLL